MAVAILQSRLLNHSVIPENAAVQLDSDAKVGETGVALPSAAKNIRPRKASLKPLTFLQLTVLKLDCIPQWLLFKSPSPCRYFQRVGPQRRTSKLLDNLHTPLTEILNRLAHISSRTLGEYVESHTKITLTSTDNTYL